MVDRLEELWQQERERADPSLWRALYKAYTYNFWMSGLWTFMESVTRLSQPVILGYMLKWMAGGARDIQTGLEWALLLSAIAFAQIYIHHAMFYFTMLSGWSCRAACQGLIHRKVLKLHLSSIEQTSSGHLLNLVSSDVQRFDLFLPFLHFGWTAPMDIAVVMALMVSQVGWTATLAGCGILLFSLPVQLAFGRRFALQRRITAQWTDQRVRVTGEVFQGISTVKSSCWEQPFGQVVSDLRSKERSSIFLSMSMKAVNGAMNFATPYVATLLTFVAFFLSGGPMDVTLVFSTVALVHVMRISVGKSLSWTLEKGPEALTSVARIKKFLMMDEMKPRFITSTDNTTPTAPSAASGTDRASEGHPATNEDEKEAVIELDNATFHWNLHPSPQDPSCLRGVTMNIHSGELVIVSGATGSGKTSLLEAILGELDTSAGTVTVRCRRIGYASQKTWINAGTLKSNIQWDQPWDRERFDRVVYACSLLTDIAELPDGEETEIGEKGVNLSGGQKARVGLARALYSKCDLYLLDDPLSAVDPEVGHHIFEKAIQGLCKEWGATVLLSTHHSPLLPFADRVILLSPEEGFEGIGTLSELRKAGKEIDMTALKDYGQTEANGDGVAGGGGLCVDEVTLDTEAADTRRSCRCSLD